MSQLPDYNTLMNSKSYTKIVDVNEFIKNFKVGDEIIFVSRLTPLSIINVNIIQIDNIHVKYTHTNQLNANRNFTTFIRIDCLFNNHNISNIFTRKDDRPTPEDILKKQTSIRHLDDYLTELKLTPIQLFDVNISFIGEDFREGQVKDFTGRKQIYL
jgi:hypothetical protein